jgi:hypothetical protein
LDGRRSLQQPETPVANIANTGIDPSVLRGINAADDAVKAFSPHERATIEGELKQAMTGVSGRWYQNERTAVAAVRAARVDVIGRKYDIEVGVALFRTPATQNDVNAATYVANAVTQFMTNAVSPIIGAQPPPGWPKTSDYAGFIHNHPTSGLNMFSDYDFSFSRQMRSNSYLLAPNGRAFMYDFHAHKAAGFQGLPTHYVREFRQ